MPICLFLSAYIFYMSDIKGIHECSQKTLEEMVHSQQSKYSLCFVVSIPSKFDDIVHSTTLTLNSYLHSSNLGSVPSKPLKSSDLNMKND